MNWKGREGSSMGKKHESTKQTTTPNLPDQVIFCNILFRLPVKSLYRLSCVSKLWRNTIYHDKSFIALHFNHAKARPSLLAVFQKNLEKEHLSSLFGIVGSCNGLICLRDSVSYKYEIYNPSTQEVLSLPHHPYGRPTCFGFGFDPLKGEYKVLNVYRTKCLIYTLGKETNSWRDITSTCNINASAVTIMNEPSLSSLNSSVPLLLNGTLYWLEHNFDKILLFDLSSEIFQVISAPATHGHPSSCCSVVLLRTFERCCRGLVELGGLLCLAQFKVRSKDEVEMDIYVLKDVNSWEREKETIILPLFDLSGSTISILGLLGKKQILVHYWMNKRRNLRFYNAHTCNVKELEFLSTEDLCRYNYNVFNHVENLLSLKTMVPQGASKPKLTYMSSRRDGMSNLTPMFVEVTGTALQKPKQAIDLQ